MPSKKKTNKVHRWSPPTFGVSSPSGNQAEGSSSESGNQAEGVSSPSGNQAEGSSSLASTFEEDLARLKIWVNTFAKPPLDQTLQTLCDALEDAKLECRAYQSELINYQNNLNSERRTIKTLEAERDQLQAERNGLKAGLKQEMQAELEQRIRVRELKSELEEKTELHRIMIVNIKALDRELVQVKAERDALQLSVSWYAAKGGVA